MKLISVKKPMAAALAVSASALMALFCNLRDNPLDPLGKNYNPGSRPHVSFLQDTLSVFALDTVAIPVACSDTASGGKPGGIRQFYISKNPGPGFDDSTGGTDSGSALIRQPFPIGKTVFRIQAVDYDAMTSDADSIVVLGNPSRPRILSVYAPSTYEKSALFTIIVSATDTGGTIQWYLWALNGKDFIDSTAVGAKSVSFSSTGEKKICVKVRDNKNITSAPDSVFVTIFEKPDTSGPSLHFIIPAKTGDTVGKAKIPVLVEATDDSKVASVTVNGEQLLPAAGRWAGTVGLKEGENTLVAVAADEKGNSNRDSIAVFYVVGYSDNTPPAIVYKTPPHSGDTVNVSSFMVKLLAFDESGVTSVLIDNIPMTYNALDSSYRYQVILKEGDNSFVIQSMDVKGATGYDTLRIFYMKIKNDSIPPLLTVTYPRQLQHVPDTGATVRGTATDASGIGSVLVNGIEAERNYPDWSARIPLRHGYDTIRVRAIDSSQNQNSATDSVIAISNFPPRFTTLASDLNGPIPVSVPYSVTVSAIDAENDWLSFNLLPSKYHSLYPPVVSSTGTGATVSFLPNQTDFTDTFRLEVRDSWNDADTLRWWVLIKSITDSAPVFVTDPKTLPNKAVALGTYTATIKAVDPFNKPIAYSLLLPPSPASMTVDAGGIISWSVAEGDTGDKLVKAVASNGHFRDTIEWSIKVSPYNWPPKLEFPGNQTIDEMKKLTITLKATDKNNDPLVYGFGSKYVSGAAFNGNVFTWTPSYNDSGTHVVVFVVRERDKSPQLSDSQTILIIVKDVNAPPSFEWIGDKSSVVNNAVSFSVKAWDPDNNAVSYKLKDPLANATLNGQTGAFSFTPAIAQIGQHQVSFIATDNGSPQLSDTATITITVREANRPPRLNFIRDTTTYKTAYLQFWISATDPDGDSVFYKMVNGPSDAYLNSRTGLFQWIPKDTPSYRVTFIATDNSTPPLSDSSKPPVNILVGNRRPVLTVPSKLPAYRGIPLTIVLRATDPDGDKITYSAANLPPAGANFNDSTFYWMPTVTQSGVFYVLFTATDDGKGWMSDRKTCTLTVVNQAPVFKNPGKDTTLALNEGDSLTFYFSAKDPDSNRVKYTMQSVPVTGASLDSLSGKFAWRPTYSQGTNTYNITVIAADTINPPLKDTVKVAVTVMNVNLPPRCTTNLVNNQATVIEGVPLTFFVSATDPDGTTPRLLNPPLSKPDNATFNPNTGAFNWTPRFDQQGIDTVIFIAADSSATPVLWGSAVVIITVVDVNQPPRCTTNLVNNQAWVAEGDSLPFTVSATDPDGGTPTLLNPPSLPDGATYNTVTGAFGWRPGFDQQGPHTVIFIARDPVTPTLLDTAWVTITVGNFNLPPRCTTNLVNNQATVIEGVPLTFAVSATDPDGTTPRLLNPPLSMPYGATFTPGTGAFNWTPGFNQQGIDTVIFVAADSSATPVLWDSAVVIITVIDNRPPRCTTNLENNQASLNEGDTLSFIVSATDPDGGTPTLLNPPLYMPPNATYNPATGAFGWRPGFDQQGPHTVIFIAQDPVAPTLTDSATVTITVNNVNRPPEIKDTIGIRIGYEQIPIQFELHASDSDAGTTLNYSMAQTTIPSTALNPTTGEFKWTPGAQQSGPYPVIFIVKDDDHNSMSDSAWDTIVVRDTTPPKLPELQEEYSVTIGSPLEIKLDAENPDNDPLTYSMTSLPTIPGSPLDPNTGKFEWTPSDAGEYKVTFTVVDNGYPTPGSDSKTVKITVTVAP